MQASGDNDVRDGFVAGADFVEEAVDSVRAAAAMVDSTLPPLSFLARGG
jgi:hypothetical protein